MKKSQIGKFIGVIIAIGLIYFAYGLIEKGQKNEISDSEINKKEPIKQEETLDINEDKVDHVEDQDPNSDGEKFKRTLESVYMNPDEMMGKEVTLSGAVHRESDFPKERFVISRLLMSRHGDHYHEQLTGLLCEWSEGSKFEDNEWVEVTGIIDAVSYYNEYTNREEMIPIIKATKVESIDAPEEKNIYEN
ncbi:TIGR03943 family putative permease subunit [Anaeromicrobium sediminis]|uniref:DUF1980 domain-containing protein n=1 Tax=Anaeromicrobium sediminis TaxID=1478221 RepID=A0A267MMF3_9FIRM|nr:hypothetical protein [Anaeromicrobium sediminis]PAB60055.1 hypothetical protein CCE28_06675 [Anaeromicrobium sediminis]